jgi:hypothetical protein
MSNYVKFTDFQAKDSLTTGDPLKIIKGQEINDEFNAIQTAVATKADYASPALLGNPTAPTQAFGNNSTRIATTAFVQTALQALHPIGSIYTAVISTNPASLFGFGTWVAFGAGRVLVGYDSGNTLFDAAEETGGSYDAVVVSHTHTTNSAGSHRHNWNDSAQYSVRDEPPNNPVNRLVGDPTFNSVQEAADNGAGLNSQNYLNLAGDHTHTVNSSGVSGTNANIQPYITVYFWKRTA